MNDYYSQFPGPSKLQASMELSRESGFETNPKWLNEFIDTCIEEECDKYGGLGSYTGWCVSVKPLILKKMKYKIQLREKSKKLLHKLFHHFKVYGIFLKLYKDIYYKPNGEYMKTIQPIYKIYFNNI